MKRYLVFAIFMLLFLADTCDDPPDPPDPADLPLPIVATGGGWFETDEGKVTFGFSGHVDMVDEKYVYKGQIQFNDHGNNRNFHGKVDGGTCDFGDPLLGDPLQCTVMGTYRPQPAKKGDSGTFVLVVEDMNALGTSSGDHIELTLNGGVFTGVHYNATLGGGSIKIHVPK